MRNVRNLLDRLKGIQRKVATYIVLEVNRGRFKEGKFTVDGLSKMFFTNKTTIYLTIDKLLISEIIECVKLKEGLYLFKRCNKESFKKVVELLKAEVDADE